MIKWNWNLACPRIKNMACQRFDWSRSGVQIGFEDIADRDTDKDIELRVRRQRYWKKRHWRGISKQGSWNMSSSMSSGGNLAQSVAERLADQIQVSSMLASLNNCFSMHFLQAIYDESLFDICLVCEYATQSDIFVNPILIWQRLHASLYPTLCSWSHVKYRHRWCHNKTISHFWSF